MEHKRILVVDDEESLVYTLKLNLELEGYDVDTANSAEEALLKDLHGFDLIILDVMMDGMSGFSMAQLLKEKQATASIPIIFCTARTGDDEVVRGLTMGADDYVCKPFSIKTLLARIKAVLRRAQGGVKPVYDLSYGGLDIDFAAKCVTVDGRPVRLSRKEYEILVFLIRGRGTIFSREEILNRVWPEGVVVVDRVVDVNIARLRSKIAPYGSHIITRPGYGYGMA